MKLLQRRLGPYVQSLLDLLYPPRCVGCERGIGVAEQPLCRWCMQSIERVDLEELLLHVRKNIPEWRARFLYAHWMFDKGGALQRAQHMLKYGQRPFFGRALGAALAGGFVSTAPGLPDLVVPIPLHRTRQLERGYNQSHALAQGICAETGFCLAANALRRVAVTRRQTGLSRSERRKNVSNSFRADPDIVSQRSVLLVDDVITTGATAASAIEALLNAGARTADFAALAHARS